jgi:hypothetical protein
MTMEPSLRILRRTLSIFAPHVAEFACFMSCPSLSMTLNLRQRRHSMYVFAHKNPEMQLDKKQTALVVADIQNEFLTEGEVTVH